MSLGEKLKFAREKNNMTQQQVADLMSIDKSTYCGYETGKRQPDAMKIKQLSKILNISGDELLETGYEKSTSPDLDIQFDDFTYALFNESKDLPQEKKDMLLEMARFMKRDIEKDKKR